MKELVAAVLLAALMLPFGAAAKDIAVPGDAATLEDAVQSLADGDRIVLGPGEYGAGLVIPEGIGFSLIGRDGAESTVIRPSDPAMNTVVAYGGGAARIEGITFDMSEAKGLFAVLLADREVALRDCRFLGGAGVRIDSCEGVLEGNSFEGCFDGIRIANSPLRIDGNHFSDSEQYDITCRASTAEIVRNRFVNTGNACIVIVGKRYHPTVGGAPGKGNVFLGSQYLVVANQSRNEIDARYNFWGPVLTSTMNRLGYPANLDEIQDYWDSDNLAAGKVDYRNWLQSEDDRGGFPILQAVLLAAVLAVLLFLLFRLVRRRRAAA
ncbi:MAG: right-handed parallel beta-helix repeat-containing protein [Candidatus Eisenbacteria bacterium]|nr:right-handed parallel beta-helix repeat-containing protein [Candidatus Eisenbacteria bacterium]